MFRLGISDQPGRDYFKRKRAWRKQNGQLWNALRKTKVWLAERRDTMTPKPAVPATEPQS